MAEAVMILFLYIGAVCLILSVLGVLADKMPNRVLFYLEDRIFGIKEEPAAEKATDSSK